MLKSADTSCLYEGIDEGFSKRVQVYAAKNLLLYTVYNHLGVTIAGRIAYSFSSRSYGSILFPLYLFCKISSAVQSGKKYISTSPYKISLRMYFDR